MKLYFLQRRLKEQISLYGTKYYISFSRGIFAWIRNVIFEHENKNNSVDRRFPVLVHFTLTDWHCEPQWRLELMQNINTEFFVYRLFEFQQFLL